MAGHGGHASKQEAAESPRFLDLTVDWLDDGLSASVDGFAPSGLRGPLFTPPGAGRSPDEATISEQPPEQSSPGLLLPQEIHHRLQVFEHPVGVQDLQADAAAGAVRQLL